MRQILRRALFVAVVGTFAGALRGSILVFPDFKGGAYDTTASQEGYESLSFLQYHTNTNLGQQTTGKNNSVVNKTKTKNEENTNNKPIEKLDDGVLESPKVDIHLAFPEQSNTSEISQTLSSTRKDEKEKPSEAADPITSDVHHEKTVNSLADEVSSQTANKVIDETKDSLVASTVAGTADSLFEENITKTTIQVSSSLVSGSNVTKDEAKKHSCFQHNSQSWLDGPRHGNDNSTLMTDDFVKRMTLDLPNLLLENNDYGQYVMGHSLCPTSSRFRNLSDSDIDEEHIKQWRIRLVYLATVYHQQRHAIAEARDRLSLIQQFGESGGSSGSSSTNVTATSCKDEMQRHNIGPYDFECPDAKFLVVSLAGVGIGINIRGGMGRAMIAGLASDRVVLVVSKSPVGPGEARKPWRLASCDREDYQCFFMPPTPCTPSHSDLSNAYALTRKEYKNLAKKGIGPKEQEDKRVWYVETSFPPQDVPLVAKETLHRHAMTLIKTLPDNDVRHPALKLAAESILEPDRPGALPHALAVTLYFMRPNLPYAQKINEIFADISSGVDPEHSIGLPVRASDKCGHESECLSFAEHMEAVTTLVEKDERFRCGQNFSTSLNPTIVFTTESRAMVKEQEIFAYNGTSKIPYIFKTNTHDVHPDTGAALNRKQKLDLSPDEVMLSAVTTLKFQLLPRATVGNCCSNFHILILEMLATGCGAASTNHYHCMQDNEDPKLRMCCTWQKQCLAEKAAAIEAFEKAMSNVTANATSQN